MKTTQISYTTVASSVYGIAASVAGSVPKGSLPKRPLWLNPRPR